MLKKLQKNVIFYSTLNKFTVQTHILIAVKLLSFMFFFYEMSYNVRTYSHAKHDRKTKMDIRDGRMIIHVFLHVLDQKS